MKWVREKDRHGTTWNLDLTYKASSAVVLTAMVCLTEPKFRNPKKPYGFAVGTCIGAVLVECEGFATPAAAKAAAREALREVLHALLQKVVYS